MKKSITGFCLAAAGTLSAQDSTKPALSITAYAETYYQYDLNKPADGNRPSFIYSHNRHNEFTINLAFIKAGYSNEKVRANLALAAGTYMNANYAAEPGVMKNLYEANAGFKLAREKNIWLDAGIFGSHIGFESAISKDCWTLTRSLAADNSPYYEAGVKVTYTTDNNRWTMAALALNGWQRIQRVAGNSLISGGTQVQFRPSGKVLLNYSTFVGTDKPDSMRLLRVFHDVYGVFALPGKWDLAAGLDIGTEEKTKTGPGVNTWYTPWLILRYSPSRKWQFAGRAEYYHDPKAVIVTTRSANGFRASGYSLNIDYRPAEQVLVRLEGRSLISPDPVFSKGEDLVKNNHFITTSIAIAF